MNRIFNCLLIVPSPSNFILNFCCAFFYTLNRRATTCSGKFNISVSLFNIPFMCIFSKPIVLIFIPQCNCPVNLDPLLIFRVFLCIRYCRDILIQACCINAVIFRLLSFHFILCLRLLSFYFFLRLRLLSFYFFLRRSFYLIICNIDNLLFVNSGYLICDYISICALWSKIIVIHLNLCTIESILQCNLEVEFFSFFNFLHILIVTIILCNINLSIIGTPDFDLTSV